ncbi:hypothetical protein FA09DRAFT_310859 [Tilletiopsis washingtonensis]|uniref:Uncharacterized protein n=1 Tax=Tilletiopsis washingtonensis TaxID=58919 RepID=A0A316Z2Y6_9BASI|nr:hypothetical protein FA09DRAFT_310859 [Tilletiopsis washingtonensis]PWN96157.1 hypothetical protein FA09DRAFT_310859 [Tilletiopsis washingtonensis]
MACVLVADGACLTLACSCRLRGSGWSSAAVAFACSSCRSVVQQPLLFGAAAAAHSASANVWSAAAVALECNGCRSGAQWLSLSCSPSPPFLWHGPSQLPRLPHHLVRSLGAGTYCFLHVVNVAAESVRARSGAMVLDCVRQPSCHRSTVTRPLVSARLVGYQHRRWVR